MDVPVVGYKLGRNLIDDGDIVFVRNKKTITARVIQFFTRSPYSHVGIAFWVEIEKQPRLMIVEAQGKTKRRILNMSFYSENQLDVIQAPKEWKFVYNKALEKLGKVDYGYFEAAYVGLREFLLQYFKITLPTKDLPGQICSEFVASVYDLKRVHISPALLAKELLNAGYKLKVKIR